eukprot:46273-Rhodomonas_salina.2
MDSFISSIARKKCHGEEGGAEEPEESRRGKFVVFTLTLRHHPDAEPTRVRQGGGRVAASFLALGKFGDNWQGILIKGSCLACSCSHLSASALQRCPHSRVFACPDWKAGCVRGRRL